ncbi:MAG: methyltransferase domain-containing protein [Rickettsiales bacterium]
MNDTFTYAFQKKLNSFARGCKSFISKNQSKLTNLEKTNLNLGLYHLKNKNINDAILRFYIVSILNTQNPDAYYLMAKCYYIKRNISKAKKNISRCLNLSKDHKECKFLNKIITHHGEIEEVPESIIKEFYDSFAPNYDSDLNESEGYFTPRDLASLARKTIKNKEIKTILDLGCGTGMCGKHFKKHFKDAKVIGVDLSHNMLSLARYKKLDKKPVYHELVNSSIYSYLNKSSKKFDVVIACLSMHYKNAIQPDLKMVKKMLHAGGVICLAFEKNLINNHDKTLSYGYENFCYNKKHIESEIDKSKLSILCSGESTIKNDKISLIYICTK